MSKLIPKRQNGGNFMSLFADYIPFTASQKQQSTKTESKKVEDKDETKGKITEEDIFKMLDKVDGLPNEMKELTESIMNMYNSVTLFIKNPEFSSSKLANMYAQNMYKLKQANFNKKEYDEAFKEVQANKGLNEIAINSSGGIYVYTRDRELKEITVDDYLNNRSEYMPITNKRLLDLRAQDPNFIYNNEVFQVVENGIGIEKVNQLIRETFSGLGETNISVAGYTSKQQDQITGGVQVLDELSQKGIQANMPIDGLYKSKLITKEQKDQAQAALTYIYNTLPIQAQTLLQIRANYSKDPIEGAKALISQYIISKQNTTKDIDVTINHSVNPDGTSKKSGKDSGQLEDENINMPMMFLKGLGQKTQFEINPGSRSSTIVYSNTLPLTDKSGNALGSYCSLEEVSKGEYQGILDWNKATMAGTRINTYDMNQILVSDGNISSIDFPIDANGNPDLSPDTVSKKQKVDAELTSKGIDLKDKQSIIENLGVINKAYQDAGLGAAYSKDGELIQGWKRFAVMNCITDEESLSIDSFSGSPLFREIDDDHEIESIEQHILEKNKNYEHSSKGWFQGKDMLIESTLWVPLNENYHNASIGNMFSIRNSTKMEELQQILDRRNQLLQQYNKANNNP